MKSTFSEISFTSLCKSPYNHTTNDGDAFFSPRCCLTLRCSSRIAFSWRSLTSPVELSCVIWRLECQYNISLFCKWTMTFFCRLITFRSSSSYYTVFRWRVWFSAIIPLPHRPPSCKYRMSDSSFLLSGLCYFALIILPLIVLWLILSLGISFAHFFASSRNPRFQNEGCIYYFPSVWNAGNPHNSSSTSALTILFEILSKILLKRKHVLSFINTKIDHLE